MNEYNQSLTVMNALFARDCQFAFATASQYVPSVRIVDTFYHDGDFYIVSYANAQKVKEIEQNPHVALCRHLYKFSGTAVNIGHPLLPQNEAIRAKLIEVFAPWYFAHNNEQDAQMCYIRVSVTRGFFYKDGHGFDVDFVSKTAKMFPFEDNIDDIC